MINFDAIIILTLNKKVLSYYAIYAVASPNNRFGKIFAFKTQFSVYPALSHPIKKRHMQNVRGNVETMVIINIT